MSNLIKSEFDDNNKQHGEWLSYYKNGQLESRINYVHGIRHGLCEEYHSNGQLWYRGYCKMGKPIGFWNLKFKRSEFHLCLL